MPQATGDLLHFVRYVLDGRDGAYKKVGGPNLEIAVQDSVIIYVFGIYMS